MLHCKTRRFGRFGEGLEGLEHSYTFDPLPTSARGSGVKTRQWSPAPESAASAVARRRVDVSEQVGLPCSEWLAKQSFKELSKVFQEFSTYDDWKLDQQ